MNFTQLHNQSDPLLICNVWDVASAKTAERLHFQAAGTSSAAIAKTLGYKDGENMSFSELIYMVERITANITLPLTVDLESGYSRDPLDIAAHIEQLANLGVVGINIEDSAVNHERTLIEAKAFAKTLFTVNNHLKKRSVNIFLNVRTDAFLIGHPDPLAETERRIPLYEEAGADGLFIPGVEQEKDIKKIVERSSLPINVMCMPNLPNFNKLKEWGVKRISMGNFLFEKMHTGLQHTLSLVVDDQSFSTVF